MSETKITVIYNSPTDPEAFEAAFGSEQLEAARQIPGYIRFEATGGVRVLFSDVEIPQR